MSQPIVPVEESTVDSLGIVSVLPFLYIAWVDGVLTPMQIELINESIQTQA
jgi:hypothetical protein